MKIMMNKMAENLNFHENDNCSNRVLGIVDFKINQLLELTDEFIFPASYSHTGKLMWKISNVYTKYKSETLVLCCVDEGIELALDTAIVEIKKRRDEFYGGSVQ
jgi:hypothetical protein